MAKIYIFYRSKLPTFCQLFSKIFRVHLPKSQDRLINSLSMHLKLSSTNKYLYLALSLLIFSSSLSANASSSQSSQLNLQNKHLETSQETSSTVDNRIASNKINKHDGRVLPATIDLIKQYEGFRSYAYIDTSGLPVIGYGQSRINGREVTMGQYITQAQADAALEAELHHIQNLVLAHVEVELTPHQLGALTSLVYNAGTRVITQSTLSRKLNAKDYRGAAAEFVRWNKANQGGRLIAMPGLTKRRIAEKNLFLTPYSAISAK